MKQYIYLVILLFLGLLIASCDNTTTNPTAPTETQGSIIVESTPTGAQIFLDNSSSSSGFTNDTLSNVDFGNHTITLKIDGYRDTTTSTSISSDVPTAKVHLVLTSTEDTTVFGPVKIWETSSTGIDQPSGLDLSSGKPVAVSGSDKGNVDIYYSTLGTGGVGYLVQSANLNQTQGLTRKTYFNISNLADLNDGKSSPIYPLNPPWTDHMSDSETHYVFLYDNDNHYSKIIITGSHQGGGTGDYSWVEVKWIYNNIVNDNRF